MIVIMIIIFPWCMLHSRYMYGIAGNFSPIIKSQQAALLLSNSVCNHTRE